MNRTTDFDVALKAAGIPIDGVSGSGLECRIDFRPEATQQQRDTANAMRSTFDWAAPESPSEREAILRVILALVRRQPIDSKYINILGKGAFNGI